MTTAVTNEKTAADLGKANIMKAEQQSSTQREAGMRRVQPIFVLLHDRKKVISASHNTFRWLAHRFGNLKAAPKPPPSHRRKSAGLIRGESRKSSFILLLVANFICHFGYSLIAQPRTKPSTDLVEFYKRATASPPDVENFVAALRPLGELPIVRGRIISSEFQFMEGARAGTNYFLRQLAASNSLNGKVIGRAGSTNFHFTKNSVSYSMGTNLVRTINDIHYQLVRQFLNMGLADIEPNTIDWHGFEFRAYDLHGAPRMGRLEISNGVPRALILSEQASSKPIKVIAYFYPDPPGALEGFPSRMVISNITDAGWQAAVENMIVSVQLADAQLDDSFFNDTQFKGTNIVHTNVFSNSIVLVTDKEGRLINISPPTQFGHSPRIAVIFSIFAVTALPLGIYIYSLQKKKVSTRK
jgi:hypothetical protein